MCGVFDCLPVAATVGRRILCLHGGISPQLHVLNDINAIQRPTVLDHEDGGLLTDLVWSDPSMEVSGIHSCAAADSRHANSFKPVAQLVLF